MDAGAVRGPENALWTPNSYPDDALWEWLPRKWQVEAGIPALLPEMLPVTTWEKNIRTEVREALWDRMRRHAYRASGFRCRICGEGGRLEAHEKWALVNETTTQVLEGIEALCPLCHKTHHLGIARRLGMLQDVKRHICRVNGWTEARLVSEIEETYEVWEQRCEWPWTVDLSWVMRSGYLFV